MTGSEAKTNKVLNVDFKRKLFGTREKPYKAALRLTGSKESLAVLYLLRDSLDGLTVYFSDTGVTYPHVREWAQRTCDKLGATLKMVSPPRPMVDNHHERGLPADVFPTWATYEFRAAMNLPQPGQMVQSGIACCSENMWTPLQKAMAADGIKNVYWPAKEADGPHGFLTSAYPPPDGVITHSPIWEWSDADVFAYLAEVGAELPEQYREINAPLHCMFCTAFLNTPTARQRLEWTKQHYPGEWPMLSDGLAMVRNTINRGCAPVVYALEVIDGE